MSSKPHENDARNGIHKLNQNAEKAGFAISKSHNKFGNIFCSGDKVDEACGSVMRKYQISFMVKYRPNYKNEK